jgi:hypothetical protein
MKQFFTDITTTKDGQSFDVVRVAMTAVIIMVVIQFATGLVAYVVGWVTEKPFPIKDYFEASMYLLVSFGAFLATGSGALLLKKTTEPNEDKPANGTDGK